MKKIHASDDRVLIYHLQNILNAEGINCFIKNDMMYTLAGEVPVNEVWPELWINNERQLLQAEKLIKDHLEPSVRSGSWQCKQCGETHEAQFTHCWKCNSDKTD